MTTLYTTAQVAESLGRHVRHISNVARWNNIGTLITRNARVFTPEEVEKMRELCNGKPGRRKRDPNAPVQEVV